MNPCGHLGVGEKVGEVGETWGPCPDQRTTIRVADNQKQRRGELPNDSQRPTLNALSGCCSRNPVAASTR